MAAAPRSSLHSSPPRESCGLFRPRCVSVAADSSSRLAKLGSCMLFLSDLCAHIEHFAIGSYQLGLFVRLLPPKSRRERSTGRARVIANMYTHNALQCKQFVDDLSLVGVCPLDCLQWYQELALPPVHIHAMRVVVHMISSICLQLLCRLNDSHYYLPV